MRLAGSSVSMALSRSSSALRLREKSSARFMGRRGSKATNAGSSSARGQFSFVGVPKTLKILPSCSRSESPVNARDWDILLLHCVLPFYTNVNRLHNFSTQKEQKYKVKRVVPGNKGTLNMISANMHPAAHTSTPVEYIGAPKSSSGLRYHLSSKSKNRSHKPY